MINNTDASAGDDPARPPRRDARRQAHRDRRTRAGRATCRRASPTARSHQTRMLYAGANRMTATRLAVLDLPEANAMRAPGEATGHMALEVAMDEMAEKLAHRPGRVAHPQRHAGRSRPRRPGAGEPAVLAAPARRVPAPGRRALRLEQAQPAPGADPRRPLARRHGRGGGVPRRAGHEVGRARAARQPRHRDGRDRHDRHRHRQLHDHRPDGGRDDGRAARAASSCGSATRAFRSPPARAGNGARRARPPASTRPA